MYIYFNFFFITNKKKKIEINIHDTTINNGNSIKRNARVA